jgi:CheY-like chemotaxis protein
VPSSSPIRSRTILVVDDEPGILNVLADMLVVEGHHVEAATSGTTALEKLGQRSYDVILSDLRMPELDGSSLYREIKRCWPHLGGRFAIFASDTACAETRRLLEELGTPSLAKPFDLEEVRDLVQRIGGPANGPSSFEATVSVSRNGR